jgi:pectinesterase
MKFVLRNCRFDGAKRFNLGRHHVDAQFYFLNCKFSSKMTNEAIRRVFYPLNGGLVSDVDIRRNGHLDQRNRRGERSYFYNCDRDGEDFDWFGDNLSSAPGSPAPDHITAEWTFGGKWNPENELSPVIQEVRVIGRQIALAFSEPVTVKGKPRLKMSTGVVADYVSGSGSETLLFELASNSGGEISAVDLNGGAIIARNASANVRVADLSLRENAREVANGP